MQYTIAFLEGMITFISPCLLPMLPIYLSYFAGGGERTAGKTITGALGFVTGFTVVFVTLGGLAGTIGSFLRQYQTAVQIVSGLVVIVFGLNFLGVFRLNLFHGSRHSVDTDNMSFFFSNGFWYGFFHRLDSLRRSFPWFSFDAGISAGPCGRRYDDAVSLFAGTWNSLSFQRGND